MKKGYKIVVNGIEGIVLKVINKNRLEVVLTKKVKSPSGLLTNHVIVNPVTTYFIETWYRDKRSES